MCTQMPMEISENLASWAVASWVCGKLGGGVLGGGELDGFEMSVYADYHKPWLVFQPSNFGMQRYSHYI